MYFLYKCGHIGGNDLAFNMQKCQAAGRLCRAKCKRKNRCRKFRNIENTVNFQQNEKLVSKIRRT